METVNISLNATPAEIENELVFQQVLLETLDQESFDYIEQKEGIERIISYLSDKLEEAKAASMNSPNILATAAGAARKRARNDSISHDEDEFISRATKSLRGSPSFGPREPDRFHHSESALERARREQRELEQRFRQEAADAAMARNLQLTSQSNSFSPPQSQMNFNRNKVQTYLDPNGRIRHINTAPETPTTPKLAHNSYNVSPSHTPPSHTPPSPAPSSIQHPPLNRNLHSMPNNAYYPGAMASNTFNPYVNGYGSNQLNQNLSQAHVLPFRSPGHHQSLQVGPSASSFANTQQMNSPNFHNPYMNNNMSSPNLFQHQSSTPPLPPLPPQMTSNFVKQEASTLKRQSMPGQYPSHDSDSDSSLEEISATDFRPSARSLTKPPSASQQSSS
jgi:hypothetical protein